MEETNSSSEPDELSTTANSRLLPTIFEPPKARSGHIRIPEPHGRRRRPKAGDFKLLAAYVAAYMGVLIPKEDYKRFVDPRGEFDDIPPLEYKL